MRPFNKTAATLVRPHPISTLCTTPLGKMWAGPWQRENYWDCREYRITNSILVQFILMSLKQLFTWRQKSDPDAWSFSLLKCRISYTQCGEGGPVARHVTLWRNSGVNIWNKYHTTTHHIPAATCWPNFSGGSLCVILFLLVWNVLISFLPTSSSLWLAAAKQSAVLLNFKIDTFGKTLRSPPCPDHRLGS